MLSHFSLNNLSYFPWLKLISLNIFVHDPIFKTKYDFFIHVIKFFPLNVKCFQLELEPKGFGA